MIVVLTGAGISQESGIPVFRGASGLWGKERLEDVATPQAFKRDPVRVNNFYNIRRASLLSGEVEPNPAHYALARLEAELSEQFLLVTQNIDNLHERAGSRQVLHMHGELLKVICTACCSVMPYEQDIAPHSLCPLCGAGKALRPQVVWFGEMPLYMDEIEDALSYCRLFVSIGTSGTVYPAAGFAATARRNGAHTVELNLEQSLNSQSFDESHQGRASEVVLAWVEELLQTVDRGRLLR